MTYLPTIPTPTLTTKCLAIRNSPGDMFPARCGLLLDHTGDHAAYNSGGPGVGVFVAETWPAT
jgi:hypothetical protein